MSPKTVVLQKSKPVSVSPQNWVNPPPKVINTPKKGQNKSQGVTTKAPKKIIRRRRKKRPSPLFYLCWQLSRRLPVLAVLTTFSFLLGAGGSLLISTSKTVSEQSSSQTPQLRVKSSGEIMQKSLSNFVFESPEEVAKKALLASPDFKIKIKAVGDIIPGTNFPNNKLHPNQKVLFQSVQSLLQGADILFGNFESTLTNYPYTPKNVGRGMVFAFRTPPSYAQLLKQVGFDILSVANNHSYDFSTQGFQDTIQNIEANGMKAIGEKGKIIYTEVKGVSTAWIGFSYFDYHNSLNQLESAKRLVQEASQNAKIVVISIHAGAEGTGALHVKNKTEYFYGENRGNMVLFSQTMIDAGADLILGHGPHVPRALELYKGKLIAYSLGNFLGYRTLSSQAQLGYSLVLDVNLNRDGNFVSGKIIPVHLNSQGIPYPDQHHRSTKLIRQLTQSDFPDTSILINNQGRILHKIYIPKASLPEENYQAKLSSSDQ